MSKFLLFRAMAFWLIVAVALLTGSYALGQTHAQSVLKSSVHLGPQETTLELILQQLENSSGCHFSYNSRLLPLQKIVSLSGNENTVAQVLNKLLADTGMEYVERAGVIIIRKSHKYTGRPRYTISGHLRDKESAENLIGANIFNSLTGAGTSTNNYGFYSITLTADTAALLISFVGYQPSQILVKLHGDTTINIDLQRSILLDEIIVSTNKQEAIHESNKMSIIALPAAQLKSMPALLGEADVLQAVQLMPGVQSGNEGNGNLYIRGGGPDQNLILLDGVPVYNSTHLMGLFSIFNIDAINNVELIKGGFPARYGGRLSSVLDISMKEGNMKKMQGEGSIGLLSSKLSLEGPIVKDKASFIVSARRTYLDLWMRPLIRMGSGDVADVGYYFYDLNAKINYKLSEKDRIYLSTYLGKDATLVRLNLNTQDYSLKVNTGTNWGNAISALRWNRIYSNKLFSNVSLTHSNYRLNVHTDVSEQGQSDEGVKDTDIRNVYFSGINDFALKGDWDYFPHPDHHIKTGAGGVFHTFNPGVYNYYSQSADTVRGLGYIDSFEYNAYAEDDIRLNRRAGLNAGLHFSGFKVKGRNYLSLQPRLALRYMLTDKVSFKTSMASMTQFIHLLTSAGVGPPTDLWVPSTENIRPQQSQQIAAGFASGIGKNLELSLEGYYKLMSGLIEYREGSSSQAYLDKSWQEKIVTGKGESYGAELLLQRKYGRLTGWLGYTLSWTYRQFDELNEGRPFPYRYDRRHDLSTALVYKIRDKVELSGMWVYGTGNAITLPVASYRSASVFPGVNSGLPVYDYEGRNNYRMAPYHRLDVSANFHKKIRWGERTWTVGVYNTYNRKNPFFIERVQTGRGVRFVQFSLFPLIPSVGYSLKF